MISLHIPGNNIWYKIPNYHYRKTGADGYKYFAALLKREVHLFSPIRFGRRDLYEKTKQHKDNSASYFRSGKERITKYAAQANTSCSEYIRTCCLSDEKVIFLTEGADIAKNFAELNAILYQCKYRHCMEEETAEKLTADMEQITELLLKVLEKCTSIHSEEDEYVNC